MILFVVYLYSKTKYMSIQELREQIQEDIIAILEGENQDMINAICDIVVDRFRQFENN